MVPILSVTLRPATMVVPGADRPVKSAVDGCDGFFRRLSRMIPDKVRAILDANGLSAREFAPGSTATSVLAAQQLGVTVGQIAKSLLFVGKDGKYFMVVCPGDKRLSNSQAEGGHGSEVADGKRGGSPRRNGVRARRGLPIRRGHGHHAVHRQEPLAATRRSIPRQEPIPPVFP